MTKLEQFDNGQHDVIDIAEARGLGLFGVVEAATPIDCSVAVTIAEPESAVNRSAHRTPAKLKEAVKDWTVRGGAQCELFQIELVL